MRRARAALSVLGLALSAVALAAAEPRLEVESGRWIVLRDVPDVLTAEAVRPHLTSGLTTTFVFRVEPGRGISPGAAAGARVEIRYEPWDEVFLVTAYGADATAIRHTAAGEAELIEWWRALRLPLLDLGIDPSYPAGKVKILLDVVPFSRAEQADTQRWYSESVHRAGRGVGETNRSAGEGGDTLEKIFSVLVATSIQRRPLTSFGWVLEMPPGTPVP